MLSAKGRRTLERRLLQAKHAVVAFLRDCDGEVDEPEVSLGSEGAGASGTKFGGFDMDAWTREDKTARGIYEAM